MTIDNPVLSGPIFAQLSSLVDQIPSVTTPVVVTYDVQDDIAGITHSTSTDPGELTVTLGGLYSIMAQPQVGKDSGAVALMFDMFLQQDTGSGFVDVQNTNVKLTVKDADITDVLILGILIKLAKGTKVRVMQRVSSTSGGLGIQFAAAEVGPPTVPATPSIIFSMSRSADLA